MNNKIITAMEKNNESYVKSEKNLPQADVELESYDENERQQSDNSGCSWGTIVFLVAMVLVRGYMHETNKQRAIDYGMNQYNTYRSVHTPSSTLFAVEMTDSAVVVSHVRELNRQCPCDVNNGVATMTDARVEGKDIIYECKLNDEARVAPSLLAKDLKKPQRTTILYQYVIHTGLEDKYNNAIIDGGYNIVYVYELPDGTKKEMRMTNEENRAIREFAIKQPEKALQEYINLHISGLNETLPIDIDEGMTLVQLKQTNKWIDFVVEIDETYSLDVIQEHKDELLKNDILSLLKKYFSPTLESCKKAKLGIRYRFKYHNGSRKVDVNFPYEELMQDPMISSLNMSEVKPAQ